ncbi:sensor histidine kinase [Clostridium sp. CTA-19]
MHYILIVILIALLSITSLKLFLNRKEIRNIKKNLNKINSSDTNEKIKISVSDKYIEELAIEINSCLKLKQQLERNYKELEVELRQAIANMSHDLRTPLTSIKGYIQLIKDEGISKEEKNEYINIIEKRANSLQMLITSFYDLSRLQANEYNFNYEKVNVGNVLCEIISEFYEEFISKGVEPNISIDEKVECVISDKNAINRIFINLIQNILKHSKGEVSISLKRKGDYMDVEFKNYAPELTLYDASHMFDRFFTRDRMRTGQNTGLGLAITKSLVEKLGGNITSKLEDKYLYINILIKI